MPLSVATEAAPFSTTPMIDGGDLGVSLFSRRCIHSMFILKSLDCLAATWLGIYAASVVDFGSHRPILSIVELSWACTTQVIA